MEELKMVKKISWRWQQFTYYDSTDCLLMTFNNYVF